MKRSLLALAISLGMLRAANAAVTVQELFDGVAQDQILTGQGANLTSAVGFAPGSTWNVNAGNLIYSAPNFNLDSTPPLPGLPPQLTGQGGLWLNEWGGDANIWRTDSWATRQLDPSAQVNFASDRTVYFSFRLNNGGDSSVGIGLASAGDGTAHFVGFGGMWNNYWSDQTAKNSLYISDGLLSQGDGPCIPRAHSLADSLNGRALIVGRLVLSAGGTDRVDLKQYDPGSTIGATAGADPWTLSYDITDPAISGMTATHLMLWMNGGYAGELDAIRMGDTWADVTGAVPEPASITLLALGAGMLVMRRRRA